MKTENTSRNRNHQLSLGTRLALAGSGVGALVYFLVVAGGPLGSWALLPLLALVPVFMGLVGLNPLAAAYEAWFTRKAQTRLNSTTNSPAYS